MTGYARRNSIHDYVYYIEDLDPCDKRFIGPYVSESSLKYVKNHDTYKLRKFKLVEVIEEN